MAATSKPRAVSSASPSNGPTLLSGGNPQIPKGYGDEPVQAYIAAMPGWKRAFGEQLDALITAAAPKATKAIKYNQPLYGMGDDLWFVSFRCFTKYVKISFFAGAQLDPLPPGAGKDPNARWLDVYEHDEFDAKQFTKWVRQAHKLPGEKL